MIRARFHTVATDYRPKRWPIRLPYRFPMPSWLRHAAALEQAAQAELDTEEKSMGQARRHALAMRLHAMNPAIHLGMTIGMLLELNNIAIQFRDLYNLGPNQTDFMATIEQALDRAEVPAPGVYEPEG